MHSAPDSPNAMDSVPINVCSTDKRSQIAPVGGAGSPLPPPINYATTAAAIANFKPSPRDVISGIAPHVFDERKRRRFQKKRATKPYLYVLNGEKRSSPLRGATVISWDETSIYLEQPDIQRTATIDMQPTAAAIVTQPTTAISVQPTTAAGIQPTTTTENNKTTNSNPPRELEKPDPRLKRRLKRDKTGWKYFSMDAQLLKSLIVKLKLSTSQNSTKP